MSESVSHILSDEHGYGFDPLQVGLVYVSPLIGSIFGTVVGGKLSDVVARTLSRRAGGFFEPEYRLLLLFPAALTSVLGLVGFGWSAQANTTLAESSQMVSTQAKVHWIVPTIFLGLAHFGCSLVSVTSVLYGIEACPQYPGEVLVCLLFNKNIIFGLIWSAFLPVLLQEVGSKQVYLIVGGIQLACMLLAIPMYVFGKRVRMWAGRRGVMKII